VGAQAVWDHALESKIGIGGSAVYVGAHPACHWRNKRHCLHLDCLRLRLARSIVATLKAPTDNAEPESEKSRAERYYPGLHGGSLDR
jgi:hypothetical protein